MPDVPNRPTAIVPVASTPMAMEPMASAPMDEAPAAAETARGELGSHLHMTLIFVTLYQFSFL